MPKTKRVEGVAQPPHVHSIHCILCGIATHLTMMPHRVNGVIVGLLYVCENCEELVAGARIVVEVPDVDGG